MPRRSCCFRCCFLPKDPQGPGSAPGNQGPPTPPILGPSSSNSSSLATPQPQNQTETVVSIDELKSIFANPQTDEQHLVSVLNFVKQAISKLKHVDMASSSSLFSSSSSSSSSGVASDAISRVPDFLQYLSTEDSMAVWPDAEHHTVTLQMLSGVLGVLGSIHWVFAGLSVAAYVLNQALLVSSNQKEATKLLDEIENLASTLVEFHEQFGSENKTLKRAIEVIIKGTIACCRVDHCPKYIGKFYRFLFANASGDLLSSLCKDISSIDRALMKECNIEIMKRNPKVSSPNKPEYVKEAVVGLETRVEDAMKLIADEESSTITTPQSQPEPHLHPCCALILHGIGGIGKSTLLTALFSKLLDSRPNYKYAYVSLHQDQTQMKPSQEVLWQHLIGSKCKFDDESDGRIKLSKGLKKLSQPVLLVIDNALKKEQLQELLPQGLNELHCGIVILVTTRDAGVGSELKRKGVKLVQNYEVHKLSNDESKKLLQKTMDAKLVTYMEENLRSLIRACDGHPLALTIAANYINDEVEDISRDLGERCKYVVESISEMRGEGKIGEGKLLEALAYSVTSLPSDSKAAFFDIVFLFKYISVNSFPWDEVHLLWDDVRDIVGVDAFKKLCNRSLINKTRYDFGDNRVGVHDLLQHLALNDMPEGSRLRSFEELQPLLQPQQQEKLKRIECLDLSQKTNRYLKQNLSSDMLHQMDSLRLLIMPYENYSEQDTDSDWQYKISPKAHLQLFIGSDLQELPLSRTDNLRLLYILDSPRLNPANVFSAANFNFVSLAILKIKNSITSSITLPVDLWNMLPNTKCIYLHCLDSLTRLPHKMKGELTSGGLTRLETLSLSGCKVLKTLPEELFCNLPSLKDLQISDCESLEELPKKGMGELTCLEKLCLSGCRVLKTLPEDLFCNLRSLKDLQISDCESLEELPKKGMGEFTHLENLSLSECEVLKTLPEDFFCNLPSLKTLKISHCGSLEELPKKGMGESTCLERLSLSECKVLKTLPEDLFCNLLSLKELYLSNCESLEELPKKGMAESTRLERLSLSGCKVLKTIPEDFFCNLLSLNELKIFDCESLEELPKKGMGEFTRLERLELSRCKVLKTLPKDLFCNLLSLKELSLSDCEILEDLPKNGMGEFTRLETLSLLRCKVLKTLPEDLFCNLPSLKDLKIFDCESLEELPRKGMGKFTRLEKLWLSGCKMLKTLPEDLFCNLLSLKVLHLSDFESLEELPKKGMGEFTRLEKLSLSGCKVLKTLPEDIFCNLLSLKELSLYNCESLEELPKKGMGESTSLESLLLGCKVLRTLPEDLFCNLLSLNELKIFDCESLEELPKKGMGEFTRLERLELSRCKVLKTLPEDLFCNLPSLKALHIYDCESLEELPKKGMGEFTCLKRLSLLKCKVLKTLPEDIFCNLPSLKTLQIYNCESLEELPKKGMGEFTRLKKLWLSGCKVLKTLPEDLFCNLPSLKALEISDCESLEELPKKGMGEFICLETLLLSGCKALKTLPEDLFCNLPLLKELQISDCESLEELPKKGMGEFTRLEKLSLSGCKVLKTLPEDLFCNLLSLKELDLSDCESLEELPKKGMGELTRLKSLSLSGCKVLKTLPESLFCNLPSSTELNLSGCESLQELPKKGM